MAKYQETTAHNGQRFLTFLNSDGELQTIDDSHPGYEDVVEALADNDVSYATHIARPLNLVGERLGSFDSDLRVSGNSVYYGHERLTNKLANMVLGYVRNGREGAEALANFVQRLYHNPNERSREQLFDWIERHGLTIDREGFIIGHKGVHTGRDGKFVSSSFGEADVNGITIRGQIPQTVGDVVTMPRSAVDDNGDAGCSSGLHVGTYDYASGFGSVLLTVRIDPADVVSVPNDCDFSKMRVCRYTVIGVNTDRVEFPKDSAYVGGTE